jgi:hypothetical protein
MTTRAVTARTDWRFGTRLVATLVAVLWLAWVWTFLLGSDAGDARAYYLANLEDLYGMAVGQQDAYLYSPAFAQLISPLTALPWMAFWALLLSANMGALVWLVGPVAAALTLALPWSPVWSELRFGNIHLLLAVMVVVALRHPAVWSFGLLTKVTPGVGLLWFAARREWRRLLIGVVATAGIVGLSAIIVPDAWVGWISMLSAASGATQALNVWPATLRVALAAVLVTLAAWRDRPAALPVIVCFAMPALWAGALVMLLAVPRMLRTDNVPRQPE